MSEILKLYFKTDEKNHIFNVPEPKEELDRDTCEKAMQDIVDSGAFEDLVEPIKAVRCDYQSEIVYEA